MRTEQQVSAVLNFATEVKISALESSPIARSPQSNSFRDATLLHGMQGDTLL